MSTTFPSTVDSFLNPTSGSLQDNADPRLKHGNQHANINDAVTALENKVGVDFSNVTTSVDYAVQVLCATLSNHAKGVHKKVVGQPFPTSTTWYADAGETIKLVSRTNTYGPGTKKFLTGVVYVFYNGTTDNIAKRTITDTITLSGAFPVTVERVIT